MKSLKVMIVDSGAFIKPRTNLRAVNSDVFKRDLTRYTDEYWNIGILILVLDY